MKDLSALEQKVIKWGEERRMFDPLHGATVLSQIGKLTEELTELTYAALGNDKNELEDAIGDMTVVLTMIARLTGTTLYKSYEHAYNEIKDRKGSMANGVFVKER